MFGGFARGTQGLRSYDKVVGEAEMTIEMEMPELRDKLSLFKMIAGASKSVDGLIAHLRDEGLSDLAEVVEEERYSDIDGKVLIDVDSAFKLSDIQSRLFQEIGKGNELAMQRFDLEPFRPEFGLTEGLGRDGEIAREYGVIEEWA